MYACLSIEVWVPEVPPASVICWRVVIPMSSVELKTALRQYMCVCMVTVVPSGKHNDGPRPLVTGS